MCLPFVEQRAELVGGGTPVGVVSKTGCQRLRLLHDGGASCDRGRHGSLACLGQLRLLGFGLGLELLILGLERGQIAHHGGGFGFFGQHLHRFVDLAGLDGGALQTCGQCIELGLEIKETTGVQRQCLFLGHVGELADLTFAVAILDEYGAVLIDVSE